MKLGRIIEQNNLHLEKLVFCGSPLFCSLELQRTTRKAASKPSESVLIADMLTNIIKTVITEWMSQCGKILGVPPT